MSKGNSKNQVKKETLKKRDIFEAVRPLRALLSERLPVRVSSSIAELVTLLNDPLKSIETTRLSIIDKYAPKNGGGPKSVPVMLEKTDNRGKVIKGADNKPIMEYNPNHDLFNKEWDELLSLEVKLSFTKVRLPEKVSSTCDKCHHNMDKDLMIEPGNLLALKKFVEVV